MSVHQDGNGWRVFWRAPDGEGKTKQKSKRFKDEGQARTYDDALKLVGTEEAATAERGLGDAGVYEYATKAGPRWRATWRDARGRSQQKRGFQSPRAALTYRTAQVDKANAGVMTVAANPKQTIGELYDEFIVARTPHIDTRDYATHGKKRIEPYFVDAETGAPLRAGKVGKPEMTAWLADMHELVEAGVYKPKTINNALIALGAFFTWAVNNDKLPSNPARGVPKLPAHFEHDYLTMAEIPRYLDGCSPVYQPLAILLILTGMRISEALGLRWDDIDWEGGRIIVYRQASGRGTAPTKSRKYRAIEVGPGLLLGTLAPLLEEQQRTIGGDLTRAPIFVMPTRVAKTDAGRWSGKGDGERMDRNTVSRDWHKDALTNAGLRNMSLHSLRHTAAAAWLLDGRTLYFVQQQLGHSSYTTTADYYGHLEQGAFKGAGAGIEARIAAARAKYEASLEEVPQLTAG